MDKSWKLCNEKEEMDTFAGYQKLKLLLTKYAFHGHYQPFLLQCLYYVLTLVPVMQGPSSMNKTRKILKQTIEKSTSIYLN